MGDSTTMTVEFLRARLLSERSVSRSAKLRADELTKRVMELEEQLKIVSLQKMKAKKATADILAILENHSSSDVSEALDSSSDQDTVPRELKVRNPSKKEGISGNSEVRRDDGEDFSGPEINSSPSSGRSLSWKSSKDSSHSHGKKNNMNFPMRKRSGFASPDSSSPKQWEGRSCRQIRRREMRSAEEPKVDLIIPDPQDTGASNNSVDFIDCSNNRCETLEEGPQSLGKRVLLEGQVSGSSEDERKEFTAEVSHDRHGREKDMERALERQAQLIGRFEAEEKAQREWEENFRDNNSCTPDSCEPGNCSGVSEERDDRKVRASCITGTVSSIDQESKSKIEGFHFPNESSKAHGYDSPASEFAFPMSRTQNEEHFESKSSPSPSNGNSFKAESSGSKKELALVSNGKTNHCIGGVLDALQQAKLSLKQKLNMLPLLEGTPTMKAIEPSFPVMRAPEKAELPVGCAQLFKVSSDFEFEATNSKFMGSNYYSSRQNALTAVDQFATSPYMETRLTASTDGQFLSGPQTNGWSRSPNQRPSLDPYSNRGVDLFAPRPYLGAGLPFSGRYIYPVYRDLMPQMTSNELFSRSPTGSAIEQRPAELFSLYEDRIRPDTYR